MKVLQIILLSIAVVAGLWPHVLWTLKAGTMDLKRSIWEGSVYWSHTGSAFLICSGCALLGFVILSCRGVVSARRAWILPQWGTVVGAFAVIYILWWGITLRT
jgi:hypothetical protein